MNPNIKVREIPKKVKVFYPGTKFPAISISGDKCELNCSHCGKQYLKHMLTADTPDKLMQICMNLSKKGANGALISGGCDQNGHVMFEEYLDTITKIKQNTELVLNIHTGIIDHNQARNVANTNVDVVSIDIVGDTHTIKKVYGLHHTPAKYRESLKALKDEGITRIIPHICIGLNYGKLSGEINAVDMLSVISPIAIVFIIMIPTEGSKMVQCSPPKNNEVMKVIEYAHIKYPKANLYLGCMRPRTNKYMEYRKKQELEALKVGVNGIVLPSKATLLKLQEQRIEIIKLNMCCAIE